MLTFIFSDKEVKANQISDEDLARAIVGEASNQGYNGMLAVACAIRNRGTLKGVYGFTSSLPNREPKWVWDLAKKAVKNSLKEDPTKGATHWENITSFGEPYWAKAMVETYKIKDHIFYKEKKKVSHGKKNRKKNNKKLS